MRIEQRQNTYYLVTKQGERALTSDRTKAISIANKLSIIIVLD